MTANTIASGSQPAAAGTSATAEPIAAAAAHFPRLTQATLTSLPATVRTAKYDRRAVKAGIVHLGTGNFALAHLASYIDDILERDPRWGIVAASLRTAKMVEALQQQDGLYTLIVRQNHNRTFQVMGPIVESIFGPENQRLLAERIADPAIKLVTVTVSNKGYCLLPHGLIDWREPDVEHDARHLDSPRSLYGYLAFGLSLRKQTGVPLTVMSLDNIPENSRSLKKALLEFLKRTYGEELADWVSENVDFPVTLVDRITPSTTSEIVAEARAHLGVESKVVVATEVFRQLVVEQPRFTFPDLESVGVEVVDDAQPYWRRKFYLLNAGHQVAAICGQRLGLKYIHEAMEQQCVFSLLERAHDEWMTVLDGDPRELQGYCASIRSRFLDLSLGDTVERVAARATSKVSERLLSSIELSYLDQGELLRVPVFMTAVWLHNLGRKDEAGHSIVLNDPDAGKLQDLHIRVMNWARHADLRRLNQCYPAVRSFLNELSDTLLETRFRRLASDDEFVRELAWSLIKVSRSGVAMAAKALVRKRKAHPRPAITHILFDCDGVLVKSEHLAFSACCTLVNEVLRQYGVAKQFAVPELMHEFVGCNFRRMIEKLSARYQFTVSNDELERLANLEVERVVTRLMQSVQPCTGINAVLAALHGKYTLAVVSSSALRRVRACMEKTGQDKYIPAAHVYSAVDSLPQPRSKPDPAPYEFAISDQQTTPERCAAVEDSVSGVTSAMLASVARVIGYVGAYPVAERTKMAQALRKAGAYRVMRSMRELPGIIARLNSASHAVHRKEA